MLSSLGHVDNMGREDQEEKAALQFRPLRDDERDKWLDLLAEAFADKGVPRAFFQRHVEVDPHWDPSGVRVCVDSDDRFVSTVRSSLLN